MTSSLSVAPLDLVGLFLATALLLVGAWRGVGWQGLRLVGVLGAVALARWLSPEIAAWVDETWPGLSPRAPHGIAWTGVFVLSLGAATLLGALGGRSDDDELPELSLRSRLLGALVGGATGAAAHVALLAALCQLGPATVIARELPGSVSGRVVDAVMQEHRVVLGAEAGTAVQRVLGSAHDAPEAGGTRARESVR